MTQTTAPQTVAGKVIYALQNGVGKLIMGLCSVICTLSVVVIQLQLDKIEASTQRTDERLGNFADAIKTIRQDNKDTNDDVIVLRIDVGSLTARIDATDKRMDAAEKRLDQRSTR
jgi:septal ring factor EnvC (AmiA/AmiB activator)